MSTVNSLPILDPAFFQTHPPGRDFYEKWRFFATWSDVLVPIYEWEGTVFVGVLSENSMPLNPLEFPHVFVIVDSGHLQKIWAFFNDTTGSASESSHEPAVTQKPTPIVASKPATAAASDDLFAQLEGLQSGNSTENSIFDSEENAGSLELSSEDFENSSDEPKEELSMELEGIIAPVSQSIDDAPDGLMQDDVATVTQTATAIDSEPDIFSAVAEQPVMPAPTAMPASVPTPTPTTASVAAKATSPSTSETPVSLEKPDWISDLFDTLASSYDKSMILIKENGKLKPWSWSSGFSNANSAQCEYDLNSRNPFRITERTLKPYHGKGLANKEMDLFFKDWNGSQSPGCLTISPIILNDQFLGVLLNVGTETSNNAFALKTSEDVARVFSQKITNSQNSPKAA